MSLLKTIVICLVLANVSYFLWARGIEPPLPAAPSGPGPTLKLVSESAGAGAALRPVDASADARSPARGDDGMVNVEASSNDSNAELLTNVKRCISVGPFRDVSEAAHAATTLRGAHYDPRQRIAEGEVWAGVWVYLPLPPTHAAGDAMLAKLKTGGFDDALEMPGPNDSSVISLGLYADSKRAQSRVAQAQALGFNPGIADRKRTGNVYWIDIDLKATDNLLNPADLQSEAGRITRLEVKGCPSAGGTQP